MKRGSGMRMTVATACMLGLAVVAACGSAGLETGAGSVDKKRPPRILSDTHIVPSFRRREADVLTADEIDEWLAAKAKHLATSTLRKLLSILRRALKRAHARGKVRQNVALLCEAPTGTEGRPSKSLTLAQAEALLTAAEDSPLHAYIVVSLLTGPRTEEMRAVTWDHIDLDGDPDADPPRPPSIQVWRSVRADGDTKTRKSRRTLRLPQRCVDTLRRHRDEQAKAREAAGDRWKDTNLVFCTSVGTELDAANVRRGFRAVVKRAGMDPTEWTPRELRHSFVSLLSDAGVAIEEISLLVGHRSTVVTETVYRQQLRPVLTEGAEAMDAVLPARKDLSA